MRYTQAYKDETMKYKKRFVLLFVFSGGEIILNNITNISCSVPTLNIPFVCTAVNPFSEAIRDRLLIVFERFILSISIQYLFYLVRRYLSLKRFVNVFVNIVYYFWCVTTEYRILQSLCPYLIQKFWAVLLLDVFILVNILITLTTLVQLFP